MANLARQNLADNKADFTILTADITEPPPLPPFDHVFANPPWHNPASTRPPNPIRSAATHQEPGTLTTWISALASLITPKGTLTLILPASLAAEAIATLHATGLPRQTLFPLWPRQGQPAKIVLIQASRTPGATSISSGLTLHEGSGYTPETEQVLRNPIPLPL
jgi:tRNA1(Val) A37 N6-methylase TrmN6